MSVVIASHGHCFDGLASAAVFTRLLARAGEQTTEITYRTCSYGPSTRPRAEELFVGARNALLDYQFLPHERLTWYFDHHRTAFADAAARDAFDERSDSGRYHFDAEYGSCTKLVADVARDRLGIGDLGLGELVEWADRIDSARFDDAEQAISRTDARMRLVSVVEHHGDDRFMKRYAPMLLERPLEEIAALGDIRRRYKPIGDKHDLFVQLVRQKSTQQGRVVFVDLTEGVLDTLGKFVTYALFPDSVYSVMVARLRNSAKVSVGYNPWSGRPLDADISALCARHGGGGHPVVGAVQLPKEQVDHARTIAREIARELAG